MDLQTIIAELEQAAAAGDTARVDAALEQLTRAGAAPTAEQNGKILEALRKADEQAVSR